MQSKQPCLLVCIHWWSLRQKDMETDVLHCMLSETWPTAAPCRLTRHHFLSRLKRKKGEINLLASKYKLTIPKVLDLIEKQSFPSSITDNLAAWKLKSWLESFCHLLVVILTIASWWVISLHRMLRNSSPSGRMGGGAWVSLKQNRSTSSLSFEGDYRKLAFTTFGFLCLTQHVKSPFSFALA